MTIQISKISSPAKKYHKKHHSKISSKSSPFFERTMALFLRHVSPWRWQYWIVSFPPAAQAFLQTCGLHGSSNLVFEAGKIWQRKVGKRKAVTRWEQQWTTICFLLFFAFEFYGTILCADSFPQRAKLMTCQVFSTNSPVHSSDEYGPMKTTENSLLMDCLPSGNLT